MERKILIEKDLILCCREQKTSDFINTSIPIKVDISVIQPVIALAHHTSVYHE